MNKLKDKFISKQNQQIIPTQISHNAKQQKQEWRYFSRGDADTGYYGYQESRCDA